MEKLNKLIADYYAIDTAQDLKKRGRTMNAYQKGKANARQKAVDFQLSLQHIYYSWGEMAEKQEEFSRLAKRYGLIKEFKENGII